MTVFGNIDDFCNHALVTELAIRKNQVRVTDIVSFLTLAAVLKVSQPCEFEATVKSTPASLDVL